MVRTPTPEAVTHASSRPHIRAIVAKPGLDGHDRGAKVVSRGLRDAGVEVIYTGLRQTPEAIATIAIQEDADVICLSILSGAHLSACRRLAEALAKHDAASIPVIVGGIIPDDDIEALAAAGVHAVFQPGARLPDIVEAVRRAAGGQS